MSTGAATSSPSGIVLHELLTGRQIFKADRRADAGARARVRGRAAVTPGIRGSAGARPIVLKARPIRRSLQDRAEFRLVEDWLIQGGWARRQRTSPVPQSHLRRAARQERFGPLMGDPFAGPAPGAGPPKRPRNTPSRHAGGGEAAPVTGKSGRVTGTPGGRPIVAPCDHRAARATAATPCARRGSCALIIRRLLRAAPRSRAAPEPPAAEMTLSVQPETAPACWSARPSGNPSSTSRGRCGRVRPGLRRVLTSLWFRARRRSRSRCRRPRPRCTVKISVEPVEPDTKARLIGKTPTFWADARRARTS
jgi:hypothetical protein